MKTIYDPESRWIGAPPLVLSQGNKAPVAVDDALSIVADSAPVTVEVLANDIDPEGAALTLVSASAVFGTAVAEADNTVTYTPPPGFTGFDTVVYEIADDLDQRDTGQINIAVTDPVLTIDVLADNTLAVNAGAGVLQITVGAPAAFAGSYALDTGDLASGPVSLVPPAISGAPGDGAVLTAIPGLWARDPAAGTPATGWQWLRDGAEIAGATGAGYTMSIADNGLAISVRETLSDAGGQRSAESAAVSYGFLPAADGALIGWWDASDAATIVQTGGLVSSWADKSGGAALTQNAGSRQPVTGVRTLNALNVLDFDGVRFMERAETLPASGDVAFHMVLAIDATGNAFEAILAVDAANDFQIDANSATQFDGRLNAVGIGTSVNLSGGPFAGPLILSVIFDRTGTGTAEVFVSGVSRGTTSYTTALDTAATLLVMTNRSENAWADGAVAELAITGDIGRRADYHAYLAGKWGVS